MKSKSLTPTSLRIVLLITILILIVATIAGFVFFQSQLIDYANKVNFDKSNASISDENVKKLKQLQTQLKDDVVAVNRAKSIVADSKFYEYQDQIIKDIIAYANAAGVTVESFTFETADPTVKAAPVAVPAAGAAAVIPLPTGLKSTKATINFKNPVNYKSALLFIKSIEQNLTKMEVTGVSMSGSPSAAQPMNIVLNPLTIEVYTR